MFTEKEGVFLIAAESTTVKQFGIGVACANDFQRKVNVYLCYFAWNRRENMLKKCIIHYISQIKSVLFDSIKCLQSFC